jgi:CSLREA domain-containing protein
MKRRTLVIITVILSLLMMAIPANASTLPINRASKAQGSASIHQVLSMYLEDSTNILPEGFHDNFAGLQNQFFCRAEGWAADPDDRTMDLNIQIFSDGVEVAQTTADSFRQDLADAGVCQDGTCSFSADLWGLISPDTDHLITVQAQDAQTGEWSNLYDTPKTLNCFRAQTFIVNSTADLEDVIQGNGICETSTPGECTLRAAIQEANANPGVDTINFDIPGEGPYTISPSYGFDFIFDPVTIDATTQPGFSGTPLIELEGSNAGPDAFGLVIFAGSSTVRGLAINRFTLTGIDLDVNGGNTIQGNYIGTDITGTIDLGNGVNGIAISQGSGSNLIGGTAAGTGNLISGNGEVGIIIVDPGSNGNVMQGNFIGTDVTGSVDLGNSSVGVIIGAGASDNVVGGTQASTRNIISGNDSAGVHIDTASSTGNLVQGNYIGTDITGTLALGNVYEGVFIGGGTSKNGVGGAEAGAGNLISGNNGNGVTIADSGTTGNMVQGNYIGTDITGTVALGNSDKGVLVVAGAVDNLIGGTFTGAGNIISGNGDFGVLIGYDGTSGNQVQGNFIGTDIHGIVGIANASGGIGIFGPTSDNLIGGTTAAARNIISGNGNTGVTICCDGATRNLVKGNFIGTDVSGTLSLGNAGDGVSIYQSADNTIGGIEAGAGNLISGNQAHGVGIYDVGTTGNLVQGNYIGTDVTGMSAVGNSLDGVVICCGGASGNTVGGTAPGARNLISGNDGSGIGIYDNTTANVVQGNLIGTDATGIGNLGNSGNGIGMAGGPTNNTIGGATNGARNTIAFNGANGVSLTSDAGTGNLISSNSIYANGGLGIDLSEDGVTQNDFLDADSGPNNLQNFPVIIMTAETWKKGALIQGALLTAGNTTLRLEFFSSDTCDASGYGEGQTYLGFTEVKANPTGLAKFKFTSQTSLSNGEFITATATDPANNTSEFSRCMQVTR